MFSKIEDLYKKESDSNNFMRKILIIYFLSFMGFYIIIRGLQLLGLFKGFWSFVISIVIFILILLLIFCYYISNKMRIKNFKNINEFRNRVLSTKRNICASEVNMMRELLLKNNWYNKQTIKEIIDHYRMLISPVNATITFMPILSIVISIFSLVVDKSGINKLILTYLIEFIIIFGIGYFFYLQIADIRNVINGEDKIYERLEEIFCELYSELIVKSKQKNQSKEINLQ